MYSVECPAWIGGRLYLPGTIQEADATEPAYKFKTPTLAGLMVSRIREMVAEVNAGRDKCTGIDTKDADGWETIE